MRPSCRKNSRVRSRQCTGIAGTTSRQTSCLTALLWCLATAAAQAQAEPPETQPEVPPPASEPSEPNAEPKPEPQPTAPAMVPPRVVHSVQPIYPLEHLSHGEHPTVVLKATILADGEVTDITIEHTAGADFDQAAIAAVQQWTFEPARREGVAIASRVGVAVHFELPELGTFEVHSVTGAEPVIPHPHDQRTPHADPEHEPVGARAEVKLELRDQARGVSDFVLDGKLLHSTPHVDGADLLRRAPGLVVTRVEGDAVGHRLMLRGFDADHGQDIELTVDGVPVNQPSHIHGQGYADLGFIIPETVKRLRVLEGVYDPAQGDFAVAGSADFELGVERRGMQLMSSYGAFNTFRELAIWAPEGQSDDTFAAVMFRKSDGFGQNRASTQASTVVQSAFGKGPLKLVLHGSAHATRARTANVLRRDDIRAGRVGFYDVYALPTTEAQNGSSARAQLSAKLRYLGERGDNAEMSLYYVFNDFRLAANYTGFIERSRLNQTQTGFGDLIEQNNTMQTVGARARYRSVRFDPFPHVHGTLELGLSARLDQISQSQNLLRAPQNQYWDKRVLADIVAADLAGYFDLDFSITRFVHLKGGVRADLLSYRIDANQNNAAAYRAEDTIAGYRRTAAGIAAGPRVVLEVLPIERLVLSASYGQGYRSPQVLMLSEGEPAPFTKVHSADLGAMVSLGRREQVHLRGSGYFTALDDDSIFQVDEGRVQSIGPTQRRGFVLHGDARPFPWLLAAGSVTYVHATLDGPPPRTASDPNPPLEKGDLLPFVPPWVLRLDTTAEHPLYDVAGAPVVGRASLGFTYWSRRPLPYSERAAPVSLLDLSLSARYRMWNLDASVFNLIGSEYAAMELSYASNFDPNSSPPRVPARHIQAGAPRTWLLTLGITL